MSKLTWKDLEEKNIAIHTPTEDLMELVVNVIAKKYDDVTYEEHIKDPDALEFGEGFNCYKENTCVELNEDMDEFDSYIYEWAYDDIGGYSSDNYQIVEYEEVKHLFENYKEIISKRLDMDGNELKVGNRVLFATTNKTIGRGVITKIDDDIGLAYIHTLKNRHTNIRCEYLLLDTTIIKEF